MKGIAILGVLGAAIVLVVAACGGSGSKSAAEQQAEHQAASTHNVDLMMSIWADDATFNNGTATLRGKAQIRAFFKTAGPFQPDHHWVSDTPAYKIRTTASGDKGTLYFECHYVDVKTGKLVAIVGADQNVQRINGKWLITSLAAATPTLKP
jgi:hypothetical protein